MDGEEIETVQDFAFLGTKIVQDGNCLEEIKRRLTFGRVAFTKIFLILKNNGVSKQLIIRL